VKIHHSRPANAFVVIPNDTARDERLSLAARGELAYLLSLPDGWNTTADAEAKRARTLRDKRGEGRDAMRRIYTELKEHGYIYYDRPQNNGVFSTVIHVADRPRTEAEWKALTDVRAADIPKSRTSVPPAETLETVDNAPDTFSQVAPMYGSPGVGTPDVGSPVHRQAVHYYEDGTTEDGKGEQRAGELGAEQPAAGGQDQSQDQEPGALRLPQVANSQKPASSRLNDKPVADDERHSPSMDPDSTTDGSCARGGEPAAPARRCEFDGCLTPDKPLANDQRYHIGCGALDRRARRALAEAGAS